MASEEAFMARENRQGRFTERRLGQAHGAIGQMKSNDGHTSRRRSELVGKSHVTREIPLSWVLGILRWPQKNSVVGGRRLSELVAKGGLDGRKRSGRWRAQKILTDAEHRGT